MLLSYDVCDLLQLYKVSGRGKQVIFIDSVGKIVWRYAGLNEVANDTAKSARNLRRNKFDI